MVTDVEAPKINTNQQFVGKVIRLSALSDLSEIKTEEKKKIPPTENRLGGRKRFSSPRSTLRRKYKK